ncbi:FUSC family protein [Telmatobacter sp. DSM 110680]|uniref:FUSC family protein n=1 Tax=Telmatobacter sp. DSM 110680 TaxID=3036704 RepID=A0AAU7DPY6_9BACT
MTNFAESPTIGRARLRSLARQMDWFRGLRAAVALCTPLVIGDLAGLSILGWAALGGFEAILADTGGPYRSRLASLATLSFGGAAGLFLGCVAGRSLVWAVPVTIAFCFFWSYLAALGPPFSSAGLLVQVIYICGIGAPPANWTTALSWSIALFAGGVWAAVLSLLLWPLDAYRPARLAVADCYNELASFLGSVYDLATREETNRLTPAPALWHRLAQHHQYRIRRAVEHGWQAVANAQGERQADSTRARQFVVLLEHADLLIARTVALAEHLEAQAANQSGSKCFQRGLESLSDLRSAERWIATLLTRRRSLTVAHARAKWREMDRLPHYLAGCLNSSDPNDSFLLAQVAESASVLQSSIESASLLRLGQSPEVSSDPASTTALAEHVDQRLRQSRLRPNLDLLAANFAFSSLTLRHALRVTVVCGLDVALILLLHIDHGYWLLLTSLIVLQPHVSGTLRRGLERIGGTVGGGIFAAILAVLLHNQLVIAAVLFPLSLLAIAVLPISYAAFAFFLTPAFVLAWLPYSGDWQLALIRILNTFAGAVISIIAMMFLFPIYERDRAPAFLRASLAADRNYLEQLLAAWRGDSSSPRSLASARRRAGLAHNDTDESLQRLLAESWPRRLPFAHFATAFVTYLRRFAQSVTTLTALQGESGWKQSAAVQNQLNLLRKRLQWLDAQLDPQNQVPDSTWPEPDHGTILIIPAEEHPGERQLERMSRQTEIMRRQLKSLRDSGWLLGSNL